jgi:hypothetical protein
MSSFTHIFNTSFFIILAIILLIAALLVVYFECKMRQQHHKIVSMLSLVSTLAEDMNEMKIRFNHSIISGGAQNKQDNSENLGITKNNTLNIESNVLSDLSSRNNYNDEHNLALIEVSDDESSANDIDDIDDIDDTDDTDDDTDDADDVDHLNDEHNSSDEENEIQDIDFNIDNIDQDNINDNKENNNIKVLIVNLLNDPLRDIETKNESTFDLDLDYSEDLYNFQPTYELPEIAEEYTKEILSLKYDVEPKENNLKSDIVLEEEKEEKEDKNENILQSIKSISINLGDENLTKDNIMDYKKIQLSKLRTIVVEKGLASNLDASKLKKNEILKLLGVE